MVRAQMGTWSKGWLLVLAVLWPAETHAFENEPARVRLAAELVDEIVSRRLPAQVSLARVPGDSAEDAVPSIATVTELRYCGVADKGAGWFRAVLRQGAATASQQLLPPADGCGQALADLARRAAAGDGQADLPGSRDGRIEGVVLADVEATFRPWELRLVIVRTAALGKPGRSRFRDALDKGRVLFVIPTAETRIQTDTGARIALYAVPSFAASSVEVAVHLGGTGQPAPSGDRSPGRTGSVGTDGNAAVDVPLSFANQVLRRLSWQRPLTVRVNRDDVDLENLAMSAEGAGASSRLAITGKATPRSVRETLRWTLASTGDPLHVSSAQAQGQLEDCSGLGTMAKIACNVRNGARSAAAEAFAQAIAQRYQGQAVHELVSPQELRFDVAGATVELRGSFLRIALGPRGLSALARFRAAP